LFGGTMLPLWFYPGWLLSVSSFLPFQYALYLPMNIYLGRTAGSDIASAFLIQIVWILILFGIERFIWYRVQHKIVVQGG
jgi:ABC-2 type transport system permease protein